MYFCGKLTLHALKGTLMIAVVILDLTYMVGGGGGGASKEQHGYSSMAVIK